MRTALRSFICLFVLFLVTFGAFCWLPASTHYHVTERYSFSAGEQDSRIYFGVMIPKSGPYQKVQDVSIVWDGETSRESVLCVEVIKLTGELPAGSHKEALIEYDVSISYGLVFWKDQMEECNVEPQDLIESDHPLIQERAAQIASGVSLWDTYRVYDFTSSYLTWSDDESDCVGGASALSAYQSGKGECGEFARLMVALCRALGIPSRPISGILMPNLEFPGMSSSTEDEHPGQAHAWVEFSNSYLWTIADPAWGSAGWSIMQFARNDGRHLRYGGADLEGKVYQELRDWATEQAPLTAKRFSALKYVLTADPRGVRIAPYVSVRKGWEGRWLNTLLVITLMTLLLCRFRNYCFRGLIGRIKTDPSKD